MQVRRVRVQIETTRGRISGVIQMPTEGYRSRTTDFLNSQETGFIALTDAQVDGPTGPQAHAYMALGCRHIVTAAEIEDLGVAEDDMFTGPPAQFPSAAPAPPAPPSVPPPGA
jgi:hypothetical protein